MKNALFFVLTFLVLALPSPVRGQDQPAPLRAFLTAGTGGGSHIAVHASLSLAHRTGDYIARGAMGFDPNFSFTFGGSGSDGSWTRELTEVAALYGRTRHQRWGWLRGALGPGFVDSEAAVGPVAPGEEPRASTAFGLAAQADGVLALSRHLGVGLTGVGNFNNLNTLAVFALSVHIGRIR
jgi:hypothetical protein